MPAETPEQSEHVARKVSLGCLSILGVALVSFTLWLVIATYSSGGHLRVRGWIMVCSAALFLIGWIRFIRRFRAERPTSSGSPR